MYRRLLSIMESNYEAGERVVLNRPYLVTGKFRMFIPSGEVILLIGGPYIRKKYGMTTFSWDALTPNGMLIKITENNF